ncbi:MAG: C39 family peptidase [Negativicutes bacterium]|jgi:ABC-type bacteriocin/lantibiotic exporter with double-glycine peptidase domain
MKKRIFLLTAVVLLLTSAWVFAKPITESDVSNLIKIPKTRQATDHTCGVASLQSLLYYYGIEIREDKLEHALHAEEYAHASDIIKYTCEQPGLTAKSEQQMTMQKLEQYIDKKVPVMVCLQAWPDNPMTIETYQKDWEDGHWVVIIGYDKTNIYMMDPSTLGNYAFVPRAEFEARWHDYEDDLTKPFIHYGIIITSNKPPTYNLNVITYME